MTSKSTVKDHLGNPALYTAEQHKAVGNEWQERLLASFAAPRRLVIRTRDERGPWLLAGAIAVPILAVALFVLSVLGWIHPAEWTQSLPAIARFEMPSLGLKEALMFAVIVNVLTFLFKDGLKDLL